MARDRLEYLDVRKDRERFLKEESDAYDKAILQLSAATIGVSLAVLDKIAMQPPVWLWLIILGWLALVVSMAIMVGSYLLSQSKLRQEIRNLDREQEGLPPIPTDKSYQIRGRKVTLRARHVNIVAGCLLVIGVVFVLWFAILNLRAKSAKSLQKELNTMADPKPPPPPPPPQKPPPPPPPPPKPPTPPPKGTPPHFEKSGGEVIESYDSEGPPPPPPTKK